MGCTKDEWRYPQDSDFINRRTNPRKATELQGPVVRKVYSVIHWIVIFSTVAKMLEKL